MATRRRKPTKRKTARKRKPRATKRTPSFAQQQFLGLVGCNCNGAPAPEPSASFEGGLGKVCVFVVQGKGRRKVYSNAASAKREARRQATSRKPAKVMRACSFGRGARFEIYAECSKKGCKKW